MQNEGITSTAIERSLQLISSALNEGINRLNEDFTNASRTLVSPIQKMERRSTRLHLVGHAFTGLAVGFVFLSIDRFVLGPHSLGLGFLGPAAAAALGAVAFLRSTA